ncbi:eukaryotic aspartyl protease domain-containing protein [Ditylenchus destructor]|nr:eukaryotic aspartyl protease domain-containing protein [Ditylenchus destructor]
MLRTLICLSLLLYIADAAVQKFMARSYLVEDEDAISHHNALRSKRLLESHENIRELFTSHELEPSIVLNRPYNSSYYTYIANVTIGTPAQTFAMEIDLWYGTDLCVLGQNANLSKVSTRIPSKHVYYPGNSSSYVDQKGNFSDYVCGKGRNASDQLNVDQISANVVMGVVDQISYYFKYYPIDGILGLNPSTPDTNANSLASQLIAGLDTPIMSWWQNQSRLNTGTAQLTLGGEDTDNCKSNYVYAPQVWSYGGSYGDFRVHLTSASVDGKSDSEVGQNTTLTLYPDQDRIYCTYDFFYVLTNASNAVYNSTTNAWHVDCDMTKAKNVILNIGGSGNVTDGSTKQLVLTGADYIHYYAYGVCIVYAYPYDWYRTVELSYLFMNNHCLAYNAKEQTVGFADAKWVNTNPKY